MEKTCSNNHMKQFHVFQYFFNKKGVRKWEQKYIFNLIDANGMWHDFIFTNSSHTLAPLIS